FVSDTTTTTDPYTLSLHDALPIWLARGLQHRRPRRRIGRPRNRSGEGGGGQTQPHLLQNRDRQGGSHARRDGEGARGGPRRRGGDRKSTRLNSSHLGISYAFFCLK